MDSNITFLTEEQVFGDKQLDTLNSILAYLRVHNNVALYNNLQQIIDKIMRYREKDNARKLKYVNEKRKTDKNYARENSKKKVSDK